MKRPIHHLLPLTLLLACGAPPGARSANGAEGSVELTRNYEEGKRYKVRFIVDAAIPAAQRLVRTQIDAEAVVTRVSESGTASLALVVDDAQLELPLHPIAIGPSHQELDGVRAQYRVDRRGRLRGEPDVEGSTAQTQAILSSLGAFLWARPSFPAEAVSEGDEWEAPVDWSWVGEQLSGDEDELTYVFEGVTDGELGRTAAISFDGRARSDTVPVTQDGSSTIRANFRVRGESMIAVEDGLSGHGSAQARARFDTTGQAEQMVASLPSEWAVEWCIAPEDTDFDDIGCGSGELLGPRVPDPAAPVATLYTGDACEPRVAEMRQTLQGVPDNPSPPAPEFTLPVVADGAEPFAAEGPALEIEGDVVRVDGRELEIDRTIEALDNLRTQWAQLRPGTDVPDFLYVMVDAETPVDTAGPILTQLAEADWNLRIVVSTGEEVSETEPSHPAPEWLENQTARMANLGPSEKAMAMAALMGVALGGCGQALQAFSSLSSADFETRARLIREGLPAAVEACGCQALDMDALEVLLLEAGGPAEGGLRWLRFPLSSESSARRLRLGRNPTVARLAEVLAARRDQEAPVRLQ
jgi:hypothetical protein